jgi:molybdate transport system substrate-binding protein
MRTRLHAPFIRCLSLLFASLLLLACGSVPTEVASELNVMTSGGFSAPYDAVIGEYAIAAVLTVHTARGASMGGAPDSIPSRLERNEPADVIILASEALDVLITQGKVVPGSRVDLVHSKIGLAVQAGGTQPDISTMEMFVQSMRDAESIAYSASASGTYLSTDLFPRLGIMDEIQDKCQRIESERVGDVVARGEAQIGFQQVSELLPIEGIDYVGMIPEELQKVTTFSAGIATGASNSEGARELIEYLSSPAVFDAIRESGLEPAN